jgi:hypothetical protein
MSCPSESLYRKEEPSYTQRNPSPLTKIPARGSVLLDPTHSVNHTKTLPQNVTDKCNGTLLTKISLFLLHEIHKADRLRA